MTEPEVADPVELDASGDAEAPESRDDEDPGRVAEPGRTKSSNWWAWPAGLVVLAWMLAHLAEVVVVRLDGRRYLSMREWWASPWGRGAAAVVVVCALVHALFGLVRAWGASVGEPERLSDPRTRAVVWFFVVALAVPAVVLTLWPWLRAL